GVPFPAVLQVILAPKRRAYGGDRACVLAIPLGQMQQFQTQIEIQTRGAGLYEFTREVQRFIFMSGVETGLVTVFCRHTSASLIIQENADPDVRSDLMGFFRRVAPEGMDWISHRTEGPDDMPAHIKAALTQTSIGIPVSNG